MSERLLSVKLRKTSNKKKSPFPLGEVDDFGNLNEAIDDGEAGHRTARRESFCACAI